MQKNYKEVTFNLPWGKIAGKLWTGKEGPKVLCMHGMFSNVSCYDKLIPLMLERVGGTWCSIDFPGSGRSDSHPPGIIVDIMQYVQDLQRVVGELRWKTFHLMAHSASTTIAFCLASLLHASVESVVSIDMVIYNVLFEGSFWSERVHNFLDKSLQVHRPRIFSRKGALDKIRFSRMTETSEESMEALFSRSAITVPGGYLLNNDPRFFIAYMYTTLTARMLEALIREIRCPILLILHNSQPQWLEMPQNKGTLDILKEHLGHQFNVITVDGPHDMIMEDPGSVAVKLQQHFTLLTSKL